MVSQTEYKFLRLPLKRTEISIPSRSSCLVYSGKCKDKPYRLSSVGVIAIEIRGSFSVIDDRGHNTAPSEARAGEIKTTLAWWIVLSIDEMPYSWTSEAGGRSGLCEVKLRHLICPDDRPDRHEARVLKESCTCRWLLSHYRFEKARILGNLTDKRYAGDTIEREREAY